MLYYFIRGNDKISNLFTAGDQLVLDMLLQNGSEVLRASGGKSVLIGRHGHDDDNTLVLTPRNIEGIVVV